MFVTETAVFVTETAVFVKEVTVFVIEATAFVTESAALEHRRGGGEAVGGRAAGLRWDSHGIPPGTEKAALGAAFLFLIPYYQNTKSSLKTRQISLRV